MLYLAHHPHWHDRFWWDEVRCRPMIDEEELTDDHVLDFALWLNTDVEMSVSSTRMLEQALYRQCRQTPKDLLQYWANTLPSWDGSPRLDTWLMDCAQTARNDYSALASRILPLSMVARAMEPGGICRDVVILEGPEGTGKSELVRALGGEEWSCIVSMSLETKESHMMLQGAWVAELAELDSLTRTEESRIKGFLTMRSDIWIPKFSNMKIARHRRTVFVGTTNEASYLKGQTGNTRFLPLGTGGSINVALFLSMRDQIFAEALSLYQRNPQQWWERTATTEALAIEEREARRLANVYEESLQAWLLKDRFDMFSYNPSWEIPIQGSTSWREIAVGFLKITTPEGWRDVGLQRQISSALRAIGWKQRLSRDDEGKVIRLWEDRSIGP
jgi:predicted P-loop ATPase